MIGVSLSALITPPKFNIALEKWWLEDFLLSYWEGKISGVNSLLNFGGVLNKSPNLNFKLLVDDLP